MTTGAAVSIHARVTCLALTLWALFADVVTVVDAQPEPVALVGHSLGGILALPDSPMAPRQERCTTTWSGPSWCPVAATASAATNPPGYLRAVDALLRRGGAGLAGPDRGGAP